MQKAVWAALVGLSVSSASTIAEKNLWLWPGVNIAGLEAPKEGDWGPPLTEELFSASAAKGFKGVRLPIKWSNHADTAAPYTIDPVFLRRIDTVLSWSRKHGLTTIVNMHHYDEMFTDPVRHQARFLAIWKQISEHYQSQSDSVFFEILNEPHDSLTSARWNALIPQALSVIRASNPTRPVLVGTADWGGPSGLSSLQLPADTNLIATFHYYAPMNFTHQGASWVDGGTSWIGTRWLGTDLEKMQVDRDLRTAAQWSKATGVPVNMGEFGAYGLKALNSDRQKWTAQVARQAEYYGMSWNYWELYQGFGIYDVQRHAWNDSLAAGALLATDRQILQYDSSFGGQNMLLNGDFAAGNSHWTSGVWDASGAASFDFSSGQFGVQVTKVPTQNWQVQLQQGGLNLQAGHSYVLSYKAKGSKGSLLSLGIIGGADVNYAYYAGQGAWSPDSNWQSQLLTFKMSVSNPNSALSFNLGGALGSVQMDDIALYDQGASTPVAPIQDGAFQLNHDGAVELRLYDLGGRLWQNKSLGFLKAGRYALPELSESTAPVLGEIYSGKQLLWSGRLR